VIASGTVGASGAAWRLYGNGVLTVDSGTITWNTTPSPWYAHRNDISEIRFTGPITAGPHLVGLFNRLASVTTIEGLHLFDTSSVTAMYRMFYGAHGLTGHLDLSGWDTSSVTSMYRMFYGASGLTSLDLSGFDTSSLNTTLHFGMGIMFGGMSSLRELTLGTNFDFVGFPGFIPSLPGVPTNAIYTGMWTDGTREFTSMQLMAYSGSVAGTWRWQTAGSVVDTDCPVCGEPVLDCTCVYDEDIPAGSGTLSDPYQMRTAGHMRFLADYGNTAGVHFRLETDITGVDFTAFPVMGIGFQGIFDGNNRTITLNINEPDLPRMGLFGTIGFGGTVSNLTLTGSVTGFNTTGALAGFNDGGTVANITVANMTVSGNNQVGGLFGVNYGTVSNVTLNNTAVSGAVNAGGLVGLNGATGVIGNVNFTSLTLNGSAVTTGTLVGQNLGVTPFAFDAFEAFGAFDGDFISDGAFYATYPYVYYAPAEYAEAYEPESGDYGDASDDDYYDGSGAADESADDVYDYDYDGGESSELERDYADAEAPDGDSDGEGDYDYTHAETLPPPYDDEDDEDDAYGDYGDASDDDDYGDLGATDEPADDVYDYDEDDLGAPEYAIKEPEHNKPNDEDDEDDESGGDDETDETDEDAVEPDYDGDAGDETDEDDSNDSTDADEDAVEPEHDDDAGDETDVEPDEDDEPDYDEYDAESDEYAEA